MTYLTLPYLDLGLSQTNPGYTEVRELLFDAVRQNPAVFNPTSKSLTDDWMILHMGPHHILEATEYGPGWGKIEAWIDRFAAEQFPEMNRIIVDCLRRHQRA